MAISLGRYVPGEPFFLLLHKIGLKTFLIFGCSTLALKAVFSLERC